MSTSPASLAPPQLLTPQQLTSSLSTMATDSNITTETQRQQQQRQHQPQMQQNKQSKRTSMSAETAVGSRNQPFFHLVSSHGQGGGLFERTQQQEYKEEGFAASAVEAQQYAQVCRRQECVYDIIQHSQNIIYRKF
jgi:hypothetical protein